MTWRPTMLVSEGMRTTLMLCILVVTVALACMIPRADGRAVSLIWDIDKSSSVHTPPGTLH